MNKKFAFVIVITSIITPIFEKFAMAENIEPRMEKKSNSDLSISQTPLLSSLSTFKLNSEDNSISSEVIKKNSSKSSAPKLIDMGQGNPRNVSNFTELSANSPNGLNSYGAFPPSLTEESLTVRTNESSLDSLKIRSSFKSSIAQVSPIDIVNPDPKNKPIGWGEIKFSSTNSPAAKLIGTDEGKIQTISTPSELSVNLLNGLNSDGDFAPTLAVDMLPYTLFRGKELTLANYRNSSLERFLANTKLSVATNKVMENSGSARLGVGLEFVLINNGDLRTDQCLMQDITYIAEREQNPNLNPCIAAIRPQAGIVEPSFKPCDRKKKSEEECRKNREEYVEYIDKQYLKAKQAAEKRGDQASIWTAAIGSSWVSPNGRYNNLQSEGMGIWTTYKQGINTNSQLLFHASYRTNERLKVNSGNNEFINADTLVGGVRLLSGDRNFRFSLETTYNRESPTGGKPNNDYLYYGLGIEPRIGENLWLSLSFGGTTGRQNGSDVQIVSGLKWNFNTGYVTLDDK
jgi:hypothetical protein